MYSEILKEQLETEHIVSILEDIGCHSVRVQEEFVSAGNPDGDNQCAIIVYKNTLTTKNYTRVGFDDFIQDIISLVQYILCINFFEAMMKICQICDFDYYYNPRKSNDLFDIIKYIESDCETAVDDKQIKILDTNVLNDYDLIPNKKWMDEGISYNSQLLFGIGFDIESERITIPIMDELGNLVGVKGRHFRENTDGCKYMYLHPCSKSQILFGLDKNIDAIKSSDTLIIVESEKSVIKLHSYGYNNIVATGGKQITDIQIDKILRLGVNNIIIAFDKDVMSAELNKICDKFNIGLDYINLEYLYDTDGYLNDKDSPTDDISVFDILMNKFKFQYQFA